MKPLHPVVLSCVPLGMDFPSYGIEIPVMDDRVARTLDHLFRTPGLEDKSWFREFTGPPISRPDIEAVHQKEFVDRLFSSELEGELLRAYELIEGGKFNRYNPDNAQIPLIELFKTVLLQAGGTLETARQALTHGMAYFLGGGMHHAMPDHGSGFCLINDLVIAAHRLHREHHIKGVWILDIDAHKGDGTAVLAAPHPWISTLSIHMGKSWPLDQEPYDDDYRLRESFRPSTLDIPIYSGEEDQYLNKLRLGLEQFEKIACTPSLVFVVAGADPYEKDQLPSTQALKLTLDQMLQRDQMIFRFCHERKIPMAWVMAGGYGSEVWEVYYQFLKWVLKKEWLHER